MSWDERDRPWRAAPRDPGAEPERPGAAPASAWLPDPRVDPGAEPGAASAPHAPALHGAIPHAAAPRDGARAALLHAGPAAIPGDVAAPSGGFDPETLSRDAQDPLPDDAPLDGGTEAASAPPAAAGARLTEVIDQRARGLDPNAEAARRRAAASAAAAHKLRGQARRRMGLLSIVFLAAYGAVATSMASISAMDPSAPRAYDGGAGPIDAVRGEIHDRNGEVLAANLPVHSLFVRRNKLLDPEAALRGLARIFPDKDPADLRRKLTAGHNFQWIERAITPAQRVAVLDLGEPGLGFGPRDMRFYPNGRTASHVLGGARWGDEGELAAEIIGDAGVEAWFDERLRDPAQADAPLELSLDIRLQAALEDVLAGAVKEYRAKGATGVLMKASTGEILAMASLPDFDPNRRRSFFDPKHQPDESPLFNRAVQAAYELGSVYKPITAAMVMDSGLAYPESTAPTGRPLFIGRSRISDFHYMPPEMTLKEIVVRSSNVGTAHFALRAGGPRLRDFLDKLGMLDRTPIELPESATGKPLSPPNWADIYTATVSYGHGITGTPVNLAAAYATLVNGGLKVTPTLLANPAPPTEADRVIKPMTSVWIRDMLHAVVHERRGTAGRADAPGYEVGGKTGTADKPNGRGGYYKDKVIATFASAFPIHDPEIVIVVTLDEAKDEANKRTAGRTAAPTVRAIVERIAPILGLRPARDADGAPASGWLATGLETGLEAD